MEQAGVRMVRVGEFAWSRMEPSEGQFDLDWLERAITAASKHSIYTVLGTPTPAPPAWLTQKYPETLRMYEDGRRAEHGNRSEEHTSELQSLAYLVCRLLLEKKKNHTNSQHMRAEHRRPRSVYISVRQTSSSLERSLSSQSVLTRSFSYRLRDWV